MRTQRGDVWAELSCFELGAESPHSCATQQRPRGRGGAPGAAGWARRGPRRRGRDTARRRFRCTASAAGQSGLRHRCPDLGPGSTAAAPAPPHAAFGSAPALERHPPPHAAGISAASFDSSSTVPLVMPGPPQPAVAEYAFQSVTGRYDVQEKYCACGTGCLILLQQLWTIRLWKCHCLDWFILMCSTPGGATVL